MQHIEFDLYCTCMSAHISQHPSLIQRQKAAKLHWLNAFSTNGVNKSRDLNWDWNWTASTWGVQLHSEVLACAVAATGRWTLWSRASLTCHLDPPQTRTPPNWGQQLQLRTEKQRHMLPRTWTPAFFFFFFNSPCLLKPHDGMTDWLTGWLKHPS